MAKQSASQAKADQDEIVTVDTVDTVETVVQPQKKVKIHAIEPIDCIIAHNAIQIRKDGEADVSQDVAAILVNAKKAYRL